MEMMRPRYAWVLEGCRREEKEEEEEEEEAEEAVT